MNEATTQDTALKLIERLLDENKALQAENERLKAMPHIVPQPWPGYTPYYPWPWEPPVLFQVTCD